MKIAVLADIHSNLPALEAVAADIAAWRPDRVIMAGDVINRGPRPLACLRFVQSRQREAGWQVVLGNHEDYVLQQGRADAARSGPEFEIYRNSYWTYKRLGPAVDHLATMPFQVSFAGPDGREVRVVHASMAGTGTGIFPKTTAAELRARIAPPPAVLCVGHTHYPLIREIDDTLVINVGSVGMPFDADRRAAYGRLTWTKGQWRPEIVRLDYAHDRVEADFYESGFVDEAGPLTKIMLVEFRQARSHLHLWMHHFAGPVLAGELSIGEAVTRYLSQLNGDAFSPH